MIVTSADDEDRYSERIELVAQAQRFQRSILAVQGSHLEGTIHFV